MKDRYAAEEHFHDSKYDNQTAYPYHYRINPTYVIFREMKEMVGDLREKKVIEYGCGEGWTTAELAALGGEIHAFDISSVAVSHAQTFLEKRHLKDKCLISKMAAENLLYPDEHFDVAFGFAILHHLDLGKAMPELYRVMKAGASAYFAEPLGTNPVINLYRKFTPQYRTEDESPLVLERFSKYCEQFESFEHSEYYLTALFSVGLSYFRLPESAVKYFNRVLLNIDRKILTRYPGLGRYAWYTIIKLVK